MAQQTSGTMDAQNTTEPADPELAANTLEQAADSLQVHHTRDEMRDACRQWDLEGYSGTKQEMAETMLEQAEERSLALLVEEGVELGGDLAADDEAAQEDEGSSPEGLVAPEDVPVEMIDSVARDYGMGAGAVKGSLAFQDTADPQPDSEADEAALEARKRAAQEQEAEQEQDSEDEQADADEQQAQEQAEDEDSEDDTQDTQDTPGSLAGHLLARSPEDYGYTAKLQMTQKQTAAIYAAFADLDATQAEVAEAADCTERYANSTLNRWRGTEDEIQAIENEGMGVPAEFHEHEVMA